MPAPLSPDIRNHFQALSLEDHSARELGLRLAISAASTVRYAAFLRKTGNLMPVSNSQTTGSRTAGAL